MRQVAASVFDTLQEIFEEPHEKQLLEEASPEQLSDELQKRGAKQVMVPIQIKRRKDAPIRHASVKGADLMRPGLQQGDVQVASVEVQEEEARVVARLAQENAPAGSKRPSGRPLGACKKQKIGEEKA